MRKRVRVAVSLIEMFLLNCFVHAQSPSSPASNPPPLQPGDRYLPSPLLSWQELSLSVIVLLFGLYVVTLQYKLLRAAKSRADEALRALTVTLIVVISLALVSSGYGKDQITPVLGLFGTIVGYLLGAAHTKKGDSSKKTDQSYEGENSGEHSNGD